MPSPERIDHTKIRELKECLPRPVCVERAAEGTLSIFRVKELFSAEWNDSASKALVIEARKSYQQYGDIPPIDPYDQKAAVYLTQVAFSEKGRPAHEWSTVRFVPGQGEPNSTEDLEFYTYNVPGRRGSIKKAILQRLPQAAGLEEEDLLEKTAAVSRLGAIQPYYDDGSTMGRASKFVGLSFALMNRQFLQDAEPFMDVRILTSQIHDSLRRVLSYPALSGRNAMPFTPAYEMLGLGRNNIGIDRSNPVVYARDFPAYFYNLEELGSSLRSLVKDGGLDPDVAGRYVPRQILEREVRRPSTSFFTNAGELLRRLNPDQMDFIDRTVHDATELCIMDAGKWREGAARMIEAAKAGNAGIV